MESKKDTVKNGKLPRLRVEGLGWDVTKEICNFDQAGHFPFDSRDLVVVVEQQVIRSYEDLLKLVSGEDYRHMDILDVKFLPVIVGG
ncbi:MAG: hypothetical protein JRJ02_08255 [Deltaproteobacteria bacterium]|nr:hypothetical protein [Deltaproteobacteria bacterium]